ncbi:T-cell immunoreceptor with Ig and ITIM domains isoform 2-T2 [Anomaloglossus baeobatrachus]|uniref:T-cell immunoreceptor with Ig and ITIM domains isoform X2 n=1 Tax=Anomaloglossus baeobatrachus TaxID=238106 RepID=UPI003F50CE83
MTAHPRDCALPMVVFLLSITVAVAETFLRAQNITATDGSSVTLKCQLLVQDTTVVQVNWNFCNNVHIAYHVNYHDTVGMVQPEFSDRVSLATDYGIVISDVNRNDTGQYCCVFTTFPHGSYTGRIYLQVVSADTWTRGPYLWIGSGLGILLVVVVVGAKKKSNAFYTNTNAKTRRPNTVGANIPNSALVIPTSEDIEREESNEYFNVILYNM